MPGRHADTARRKQLIPKFELGGLLANALAVAAGLAVVFGVVTYAVATQDSSGDTSTVQPTQASGLRGRTVGGVSAPRIVGHPALASTGSSAQFRFAEPARSAPFTCQLDDEARAPCHSPVSLDGLDPGAHDFLVRGTAIAGRMPASSLFRWNVYRPQPFSIVPQLSRLPQLYPGAPAVALPLRVINPNNRPIAVTSLKVSVRRSPAGCSSARNLELIPSNASPRRPLRIGARRSAQVPVGSVGAPAIRLRNLPVNQDACRSAHLPLLFTGSAH